MNTQAIKIATLGPAGTFSELAAQRLARDKGITADIELVDNLNTVLNVVNSTTLGLVPIENLSEGFVSPVVDSLVAKPLRIIAETKLPVEFQVVANREEPEHLWAQFVAAGQCRQVLQQLDLPIIHTSSNSEALIKLQNALSPAAALIPAHVPCPDDLHVIQPRAADIAHNETRFVLLSASQTTPRFDDKLPWKSSVLLVDDDDHPGLLVDSLSVFARRGINLTSIVSRPTGGKFGQYHFFIDFDGHIDQPHIKEAVEQLGKLNQVRWLGSYRAA
jgi:prephenate dehydratase